MPKGLRQPSGHQSVGGVLGWLALGGVTGRLGAASGVLELSSEKRSGSSAASVRAGHRVKLPEALRLLPGAERGSRLTFLADLGGGAGLGAAAGLAGTGFGGFLATSAGLAAAGWWLAVLAGGFGSTTAGAVLA